MRAIGRSIIKSVAIGIGVLALLAQAGPSVAYEEDTHFLMTYVACRSVGFTHAEALTVAAVNQGMDDSKYTVANHGPGEAVPQATNQWLWHALDRLGRMKAKGIVRRKEHLFHVAVSRGTRRERLLYLGAFFHYQQDTWAHRHHYGVRPHSRSAFTTYETPFGHARHGHQPDRPPFDPVAAYLALEETFIYARQFVRKVLKRPPNTFFKSGVKPFSGAIRDNKWNDKRKGEYFHMLGFKRQPENDQQMYLVELIQAQIGAYTVSADKNPYYVGNATADKVNLDVVRVALEEVTNKYADRMGFKQFPLPDERAKSDKGFANLKNSNLVSVAAFNGRAGQNRSARSDVGLRANERVSINGKTNLSSIVTANDGAHVRSISLNSSEGLLDYKLIVYARGPEGFGSGNMYLGFTDAGGEEHCIFIFDKTLKTHTLRYSSNNPAITKIKWSNNGNLVTGCPD